jgi:HPt (histidine-containing phosphotransfer) domain-containing protein
MSDFTGINPQGLARLNKLGGPAFVIKMIDLFLGEIPERLSAARRGEQAGDLHAVGEAAHAIRSSAHNFGGDNLAFLAQKIEGMTRLNNCENLPELLDNLEQTYAVAKTWLESQRTNFIK